MDDVFRALADPGRRRLLDSLNARNGQTLGELCGELDMTRQSVSKHLAVLEAAQVVVTSRRGREKLHFLNAAPINAVADRWISRYDRARAQALADLTTALEVPVTSTDFVYVSYIATTPDKLFKALGDPTRILILHLLATAGRPMNVGEIGLSQSCSMAGVSRSPSTLMTTMRVCWRSRA